MQYALYLPNFGAEHSARGLAELARDAEEAGWDGFFVWDHVIAGETGMPMLDVWVALAAMAMTTSRIRLGQQSRRCRAAVRGSWPAKPSRWTTCRTGG
jgi:hypothetical protein